MTSQTAAAPTCAPDPHVWAAKMRGGEPIQVEICMGCGQFNWDGLRVQAEQIVADTRRKVAEEHAETFEEWRVTGKPGPDYRAYDFTWTPDRGDTDPEASARTFIALIKHGDDWQDGPHLSRRVVTRTAWQDIARGSGNGDSGGPLDDTTIKEMS